MEENIDKISGIVWLHVYVHTHTHTHTYLQGEGLVPAWVLRPVDVSWGLIDGMTDPYSTVRIHTCQSIVLCQFSLEDKKRRRRGGEKGERQRGQ